MGDLFKICNRVGSSIIKWEILVFVLTLANIVLILVVQGIVLPLVNVKTQTVLTCVSKTFGILWGFQVGFSIWFFGQWRVKFNRKLAGLSDGVEKLSKKQKTVRNSTGRLFVVERGETYNEGNPCAIDEGLLNLGDCEKMPKIIPFDDYSLSKTRYWKSFSNSGNFGLIVHFFCLFTFIFFILGMAFFSATLSSVGDSKYKLADSVDAILCVGYSFLAFSLMLAIFDVEFFLLRAYGDGKLNPFVEDNRIECVEGEVTTGSSDEVILNGYLVRNASSENIFCGSLNYGIYSRKSFSSSLVSSLTYYNDIVELGVGIQNFFPGSDGLHFDHPKDACGVCTRTIFFDLCASELHRGVSMNELVKDYNVLLSTAGVPFKISSARLQKLPTNNTVVVNVPKEDPTCIHDVCCVVVELTNW